MKTDTGSQAAAVRWLARRESGAWTGADQAEFDQWLKAATAHRIQYLRVKNFWNHAARMKALGAGVPPGVVPPRESWGDVRFLNGTSDVADASETTQPDIVNKATSRRRFLAAAACVMVVLVAGVYAINARWFAGDRYSTPIGGRDTVALSDGSQVMLNTDSKIRLKLSPTERRIDLEQGEAYFDVARDRMRPFIVEAGDKRVVAVGTKFSVRRDSADIQVVVTEGKVAVEGGTASEVLLAAGSIARTSRSEVMVRKDVASQAEKILSWRRGYVAFDEMALADAVAEFNRYTSRKIVIEDPAIAAFLVGGNFRSDNADAFLDLLHNGFLIAVEKTEHRVVLRGR